MAKPRIRERHDFRQGSTVTIVDEYGSSTVSFPARSSWTFYERIVDQQGGSRKSIKPCSHIKVTLASGAAALQKPVVDGSTVSYPDRSDLGNPEDYAPGGPSPEDVQQFLRDALNHVSAQISPQIDFGNFIRELRELEVRFWKRFRDLIRRAAAGHLTWKFVIKTTISDLKSLLSVVKSVRKRLAFLKRTYGKPYVTRFKRVFEEEIDLPDRVGYESNLYPVVDPTRSLTIGGEMQTVKHVLTAGFIMQHQYPGLDDALAFARAMEAALGLNNLVKTIWNATKLSFIFEYFVDIEPLLDQFGVDPFRDERGFEVKPKILDSWFSIKSTSVWRIWGASDITIVEERPFGPPRTRSSPKSLGTLLSRSYTRQRGLPLQGSSLFGSTGGPTADQLITIGEIIITRGR